MMNKYILWFGILLVTCIPCKKDNVNIEIDITLNEWKVIKIKKQGEGVYLNATENYIFKFINDTTFSLKLDVNGCGGRYKIISEGNIELGDLYCTLACCDSDYAKELLLLIPKMIKYYGEGNKLIFHGQGEVILEKSK